MRIIPLLFMFLLIKISLTQAQDVQILEEGNMKVEFSLSQDTVRLLIEAPTTGWVAVGFNEKNDIVHTDLKMMRVVEGKGEVEDQYVQGPGIHPQDLEIGGAQDVYVSSASEMNGKTLLEIKIPSHTGDRFDFEVNKGESLWLILAYSVSDDFDQHSRWRRHFEVTF